MKTKHPTKFLGHPLSAVGKVSTVKIKRPPAAQEIRAYKSDWLASTNADLLMAYLGE